MRIAFRTDASIQIGTGHVMRCLTLADTLRERGAQCCFISRAHPGHLLDLITLRGHEAIALPAGEDDYSSDAAPAHAAWLGTDWATDAAQTREALGSQGVDWLVVDHYALDCHWEQALRTACHRLMVIDDLADRPHDCDLLLDQNLGREHADYEAQVPQGCGVLVGPRYALLRAGFIAMRSYSLARREQPELKRLLVTMGGVDSENATGKVLAVLQDCGLPDGCRITVVMGPHAPWLEQVRMLAAAMPVPTEVLVNVTDMERLMAECDVAVGAAGSTSWERCALGVPSILLILAQNQRVIANALEAAGAVQLAHASTLDADFARFFGPGLESRLRAQSLAARAVTEGDGAALVAGYLLRGRTT